MRIIACFTGCKALQSYYKKSGYQYMENIALHFLPVLVSRRLRPPPGAVVVEVVLAVGVLAVVGLEFAAIGAAVAAVVELGSSPQLTTVTT